MGTKVQYKSYLPGYYSMRDLNEDNNSSWPPYYEDKTLKGVQYCNGFLPRHHTDVYLGYEKEMLKQTMLKHEAIFRDQVYELHRIYKIQRDLMDELKRKDVRKYTFSMAPSQSSLFPSQMPSEVQKMQQNPTIRPSISGTENMQSTFSSVKEKNKQVGSVLVQNGGSSNECKLPRKMIDLQLPADEYIDSEEGEPTEEEKLSNHRDAPESDVKLCLGNGGNVNDTGCSLRADSCLRSTNGLTDLNEPIQVDEATSSASLDFLGPITSHGEVHLRDPPGKPKSGTLESPKEFWKGRANGICSSMLHLESEGNKPEWPCYNPEAGLSRINSSCLPKSFSPKKLSTVSETVPVNRPCEIPAFLHSHQIQRESWAEMTRERNATTNNYPGSVVAGHVPCQYPTFHQSDISQPPLFFSCRKTMDSLSQNAGAVQALPCSDPYASSSRSSNVSIQGDEIFGDKWSLNRNLRLNPSLRGEASHCNGFYRGLPLESEQVKFPRAGFDYLNCGGSTSTTGYSENHSAYKYFKAPECIDVKSAKDMNLNVALPIDFKDGVPQENHSIDGGGKHEDQPRGLPWLRAKSASNDGPARGNGGSPHLKLGFLEEYSMQSLNKSGNSSSHTLSFIQNIMSAPSRHDTGPKKTEPEGCSTEKKIAGLPIFDKAQTPTNQSSFLGSSTKSHPDASEVEGADNSVELGAAHIDLSLYSKLLDSGVKLTTEDEMVKNGLDYSRGSSRNHINLNACTTEEEIPSEFSVPRDRMRTAFEIDLEALPILDTEDIPPLRDNHIGDQPEVPVDSSHQEAGEHHEELARIAAESLLSISSSTVGVQVGESNCQPPPDSSLIDSLYWFAEVVISNMGDLESEVKVTSRVEDGCDHDGSSSEGIDYFESMTLKLTEVKVEEYWCRPQALENQEEEIVSISKVSRPRKGQGRRGRQRRDFQRDILPSLASLSRHEVTEDLQTIGGLMRATGRTWETGLARRNATRNGWARGRRSSRGPVLTVEAPAVCLPPVQPLINNSEVGLEEGNLTGWGKTPRRPRRQRCPAGNPPPIPSLTIV